MPLGLYYESIIQDPQPIPEEKPEEPPTSAPRDEPAEPSKTPRGRKQKDDKTKAATPTVSDSPPIPTPSADTTSSASAQARVIFGSRLLGPAERAERLAAIRSQSRIIAGVLVPPRPEEPDNCCMSGCVNCVWDRYRDDMEEWATSSAEAERRLRAHEAGASIAATADSMTARSPTSNTTMRVPDHGAAAATSMDDDGGGSASSWDVGNVAGQGAGGTLTKDFWDDNLYKNVPVGIREFMKQEKRLKEKHMQEGTIGG